MTLTNCRNGSQLPLRQLVSVNVLYTCTCLIKIAILSHYAYYCYIGEMRIAVLPGMGAGAAGIGSIVRLERLQ